MLDDVKIRRVVVLGRDTEARHTLGMLGFDERLKVFAPHAFDETEAARTWELGRQVARLNVSPKFVATEVARGHVDAAGALQPVQRQDSAKLDLGLDAIHVVVELLTGIGLDPRHGQMHCRRGQEQPRDLCRGRQDVCSAALARIVDRGFAHDFFAAWCRCGRTSRMHAAPVQPGCSEQGEHRRVEHAQTDARRVRSQTR